MNDKLFLYFQHLAPQHLLSRCVGALAQSQWRFLKNPFIAWFAKRYAVNMDEAVCSAPLEYASFNEFFTRALKPEMRPIDPKDNAIVSPADGVVSQFGDIDNGTLLQAKGKHFSLTNLLGGDPEAAQAFQEGSFCTVYLSPKDYHRVHMPLAGMLQRMVHVPGKLFSVNQLTSENVDDLFARNERVVCFFDTECGPMALVLVGAMIVASVDTVWAGQVCPRRVKRVDVDYTSQAPAVQIAKGEEMGRFKLGSTVVAVFGPGVAKFSESLEAGDTVRMGEMLGLTEALEACAD